MTETHGNLPFSYRLTWLKDHFANSLIAKKAPVNYTEDICVFFKKYDTLNLHPLRRYAMAIMGHINHTLKNINKDLDTEELNISLPLTLHSLTLHQRPIARLRVLTI